MDEETFRKLQEQELRLQELSKKQIFQLQQGLRQEKSSIMNKLSVQDERKKENLEKNIQEEIQRREQRRIQLEEAKKEPSSRLDYIRNPSEKYETSNERRYQENNRDEYELSPMDKERKERKNRQGTNSIREDTEENRYDVNM